MSIPVQEFDVGEQWKARLHDAHDKNVNVDGQRKSPGQWTSGKELGLTACPGNLPVAAALKAPVASQLRTQARLGQPDAYVFGADGAMLFNIGPGDTIRDTLVADRVGKPMEDRVIVMAVDGFNKTAFLEGGPDVFNQILLTGDLTDAVDERCRESQSIPLRSCQAQTSCYVIRLKLTKCLNSHVNRRRIGDLLRA